MDPTRDEPPGAPPQRDHGGHSAPAGEEARYWRHAAVPGVDLLRATYVTHRYARHSAVALLAALIAVQAMGRGESLAIDPARLAGLGAAAAALLLRAPFLVVILTAAGTAAGLRALGVA